MKKFMALILAMALVCFGAVGCGGEDSKAGGGSSTSGS